MNFKINPDFSKYESLVRQLISDFDNKGEVIGTANRNSVKAFDAGDFQVNIKSFKIPHFFNKIAYGYFRKSKARRSFEYANRLLDSGIGTPKPIAYAENFTLLGLKESYYVSEQLAFDLMFRELTTNTDYPDSRKILRQFAAFSFGLHEKGIEFIDNTSGNTLIRKRDDGNYDFYLVDLNRMNFHAEMPFSLRMSNLGKLTTNRVILKTLAEEYSLLSGHPAEEVYEMLTESAEASLERFRRRRRMKQKLRFWKK